MTETWGTLTKNQRALSRRERSLTVFAPRLATSMMKTKLSYRRHQNDGENGSDIKQGNFARH